MGKTHWLVPRLGGVPGGGCHSLLGLKVAWRRKPKHPAGLRWPAGDVPVKVQADVCRSQPVSSCLSQQGENKPDKQLKEQILKGAGGQWQWEPLGQHSRSRRRTCISTRILPLGKDRLGGKAHLSRDLGK